MLNSVLVDNLSMFCFNPNEAKTSDVNGIIRGKLSAGRGEKKKRKLNIKLIENNYSIKFK